MEERKGFKSLPPSSAPMSRCCTEKEETGNGLTLYSMTGNPLIDDMTGTLCGGLMKVTRCFPAKTPKAHFVGNQTKMHLKGGQIYSLS